MNEIDLCVSGSDAITQVKAVLNGLDVDPDAATEVDISIRLEESEEPETPNGDEPKQNGSQRSLEGIKEDTNHHVILTYLAGGGQVTSTEAQADLAEADIPKSSIQAALSELYHKKLADRTEEHPAEYHISEHGKNVIEELGKADV